MADDLSENGSFAAGFNYRRYLPWLALLRAGNLAFNPGKILLGAVGAVAMSLGYFLLALPVSTGTGDDPEVKYGPAATVKRFAVMPWQPTIGSTNLSPTEVLEGGQVVVAMRSAADPWTRYVMPFVYVFTGGGYAWYWLLASAWTLLVGALVGGAITRMTALEFARDSTVGLGEAVRFAVTHFRAYVLGPALPIAGSAVILMLCALGGLIAWAPALDIVMGVLWFLAILGGGVMAVALIGLFFLWPLTHPAISVEATEGIDALTRGYSYVIGRPWNYAFYWIVAIVNGAAVVTIVSLVAYSSLALSQYSVGWGMGDANVKAVYAYAPEAMGWRAALSGGAKPEGTKAVAAYLVGFWSHLVFLVVVGFAYSYFWTASTMIYFLMRRDVDEIDISEVDAGDEDDDPFPNLPAGPPPGGPQLQIIEKPDPLPPKAADTAPPKAVDPAPPSFPTPPTADSPPPE